MSEPQFQRLRRLSILLACVSLALAGALAWLLLPQFLPYQSAKVRYDEDIVFPVKTFVSSDAWVAVKGTLIADWIGYKNNTFSILCLPDECIVASVEQIGPKQVGSIDGPVTYPVIRWTNDEVVAQSDAFCAQNHDHFPAQIGNCPMGRNADQSNRRCLQERRQYYPQGFHRDFTLLAALKAAVIIRCVLHVSRRRSKFLCYHRACCSPWLDQERKESACIGSMGKREAALPSKKGIPLPGCPFV